MPDIRYQIAVNGEVDNGLTAEAAEIEVQQTIEGPTTFRVRFAVDICGDDLSLLDDKRRVHYKQCLHRNDAFIPLWLRLHRVGEIECPQRGIEIGHEPVLRVVQARFADRRRDGRAEQRDLPRG